MRKSLLDRFPPNAHPLILASDPDNLLGEESLLADLAARGFTLIQESDPVLLRRRIEQARPFTRQTPALVITPDAVETLPYDLWQQGHRLVLALHTYFPNLAYPPVRALLPHQRARLWNAAQPPAKLGRRGTLEFLLRRVFDLDLESLGSPAYLLGWLDRYHQELAPLPEELLTPLLDHLQAIPAYAGWPLRDLLLSREAFAGFLQEQWLTFVQRQIGEVSPAEALYRTGHGALIPFDSDPRLQDCLPGLVRSGSLLPLQVSEPRDLPPWAGIAIVAGGQDRRPRRVVQLLAALAESLAHLSGAASWESWKACARAWAELDNLWCSEGFQPVAEQRELHNDLQIATDKAFLEWLRGRYTSLGAQQLPIPHHVHHIPPYLAYLHSQGKINNFALLILDGLSLADWGLIAPQWQARNPAWRFEEQMLLAQIPTITSISRLALAGGLLPSDLVLPGAPRDEAEAWRAFWRRAGLPDNAVSTWSLALDRAEPPPELTSPRLQAVCLIERTIDELIHGSVLGSAALQASLRLWLEPGSGDRHSSLKLEALLDGLLDRGFAVFFTSDHGHCEARGMGQPSEGLAAQTRGKRARLYPDRRAARRIQDAFPETILWENDGLMAEGLAALMPAGRRAFATFEETVVTHGGLTLDEVVVPLVQIHKSATI